jgi:cell division septation protein DedD
VDPISVPAPPRSAYNQNRRVSDLLLSQLKHFQHVEMKRGDLGIDPAIARDIYTEAGAARYIAAVTVALREKTPATAAQVSSVPAPAPAATKEASISPPPASAADAVKTSPAVPPKAPRKKATAKTPVAKSTPAARSTKGKR